jgi:uncharacterized protein
MSDSEPPSSGRGLVGYVDRKLSVFGAFGWTCFVMFVFLMALQVTIAIRVDFERDVVNAQACYALAFAVGIYGIGRIHLPTRDTADVVSFRRASPILFLLAVAAGAALLAPASWLESFLNQRFPVDAERLAIFDESWRAQSVIRKGVLILTVIGVGPFFEEVFCRGALFRVLRRTHSGHVTVLTSSVCFSLLHLPELRTCAWALLAGVALGYLRELAGSALVSLAAHMTFNGIAVVAMLQAGGEAAAASSEPFPVLFYVTGTVTVIGLLGAVAFLASRSAAAQSAREADLR